MARRPDEKAGAMDTGDLNKAAFETAERTLNHNGTRADRATKLLLHAKKVMKEEKKLLAMAAAQFERDENEAKAILARAGRRNEKVATLLKSVIGVILDPKTPGVEACDLAERNFGGASVLLPGSLKDPTVASINWRGTMANRARSKEIGKAKETEVAIFGEVARRLTPQELLESVPRDKAMALFGKMVEDAADNFKPTKAKLVMDVLRDFMKFVEPKAVIQTETPIEQMDQDEAAEFLRSAMVIIERES